MSLEALLEVEFIQSAFGKFLKDLVEVSGLDVAHLQINEHLLTTSPGVSEGYRTPVLDGSMRSDAEGASIELASSSGYEIDSFLIREPTPNELSFSKPARDYLELAEEYLKRDLEILQKPPTYVSTDDTSGLVEQYNQLIEQIKTAQRQPNPEVSVQRYYDAVTALQLKAEEKILFSI